MIKKKHIKKCKENAKKENKLKKKAIVYESEDLNQERYREQFIVDFKKDVKGWFSTLDLIASHEGTWTESLKGKALVSIKTYDGEVRLTLKKPSGDPKVIDLSLSDFADIILAGKLLHKLNDGGVFSKYKVKVKK